MGYISQLNIVYVPPTHISISVVKLYCFRLYIAWYVSVSLHAFSLKWPLLAHATIADIYLVAHDDVMTWEHFPQRSPFVWESTFYRWIHLTKGQ